MDHERRLYSSGYNPLFIKPCRPLPKKVAIVRAGTIGPDVGYYIKSALPGIRLYLVGRSMQPNPRIETLRLVLPSFRYNMYLSSFSQLVSAF